MTAASTSMETAAETLPGAEARTAPLTSCTATAFVLLVDRSGSMSGLPMAEAKNAATLLVEALGPTDCFELVAFDSVATRVIPLANVSDRSAMKTAVGTVREGGGTDFSVALRYALDDVMRASRAKRRIVVLLTDGQGPSNGLRELALGIAREGGVLSTIGLGTGTDEALLRMLATSGKGRFTKVTDPTKLGPVVKDELTRTK